MWRCFDFIKKLPPGSQLDEIEWFKTGDFCIELFALLIRHVSHDCPPPRQVDRHIALLPRTVQSRNGIDLSIPTPAIKKENQGLRPFYSYESEQILPQGTEKRQADKLSR